MKNTHRRVFILKAATLIKVTLLHGYFSRFLNCRNSTKSRKTSQKYSCASERFFWSDRDYMARIEIGWNHCLKRTVLTTYFYSYISFLVFHEMQSSSLLSITPLKTDVGILFPFCITYLTKMSLMTTMVLQLLSRVLFNHYLQITCIFLF